MSRMKKIIIAIALILIALFGICTISNAIYKVGTKVKIGDSEYQSGRYNLLCCQYGQLLGNPGTMYNTVANIHIEGKTATDHTGKSVSDWSNAKLAYILSRDVSHPYSSPSQYSVWRYMATWINKVGKELKGVNKGFAYNSYVSGFENWDKEANKYADKVQSENISNKTDKDQIKVEAYDGHNYGNYIKVGPFCYEYGGKLSNIEISESKTNKTVKIENVGVYSSQQTFEIGGLDKIKSGKNFYILIPIDSGIGEINGIKVVADCNVKTADIAFLQSSIGVWQNLLQYEHSEKTVPLEDNWKDINIPLLINLSGFVWEDMLGGKDNNYAAYGENIYAEGDKLKPGVTVRLKDKDGNILKNIDGQDAIATTDENGAYKFTNILIANLEGCWIEFEYDGLTYTSVKPLEGENDEVNSKAGEVVEERKALNNAFTEITNKDDINDRSHGYSRDGSGTATGTLTYKNDTASWQSTFESTTYNTNLTANTNVANYNIGDQFKNNNYKVNEDGSLEIQYLNLGIVAREQPQMSISNDIENVRIDVNGYHHIYDYAKRKTQVQDGSAFNVGVKFGSEYTSSYRRAVYPSDIQFSAEEAKDDDARKLKVYVTYATTIRNMSNSLQMSVNELVNYYDKEYTRVDSWIENGANIKDTWKNTSKYGQTYNDGNYIGAYTASLAGTKINAGENIKVYITFQVSENAVRGLLSGNATLHNTTEIFSYSTYYGSDIEGCNTRDIYAGIDRVSAPGNAKPGDKSTYEADTDDAPSMILEAKGVRELAGTVFEDATDKDLQSGKERLGSGIYEDNENTVSGVKVDLLKVSDGAIATVYPPADTDKENATNVSTAKDGEPATVMTGTDGKYIIRGIEPDIYLIRYTYANGDTKLYKPNKDAQGNITYEEITDRKITVQDYKSTIIKSSAIKQAFDDTSATHTSWYTDTEKQGRYSDARDTYANREKIDEQIVTLDGKIQSAVDDSLKDDNKDKEIKITKDDGKEEILIKSLDANTPNFEIPLEYGDIITEATGDRYTALTENIDFGLVERPRQSATLGKEVAYLKVTLPNGQVLIDCDPRTGTHDYVTVTKDADGKVQEIYITIDSELIYGSQVEIKYDFTLANTSELDYRNESYYYYGDSKENPVKFTSATLIDYVDSDITLKAGQEGTWNVVNDLVNKGYNWNLTPEQEQQILKNYSTLVKAEPISNTEPIAAGESKTTSIIVEKLLANSDELTYENNGEVVKIGKTGGRTMTTTLGSYAPRLLADVNAEPEVINGLVETDEAKAEAVTIIPPTGSTDNTVMYAIIGVTSLVVLAAGIFGTRKFLKK